MTLSHRISADFNSSDDFKSSDEFQTMCISESNASSCFICPVTQFRQMDRDLFSNENPINGYFA